MKTNKDIQSTIDKTLQAFDTIETVEVSPFFKDKVMQRLFLEKEEPETVRFWFAPKMQLATLICVLILNSLVLAKLQKTDYKEDVSQFAESFELSTDNDTSTLSFP
ncbi:hypothetical protein [Aquimarina addita]